MKSKFIYVNETSNGTLRISRKHYRDAKNYFSKSTAFRVSTYKSLNEEAIVVYLKGSDKWFVSLYKSLVTSIKE